MSDSRLQIDALCDEFEQRLRADHAACIEDYLPRVDSHLRESLLEELLAVEIEIMQQVGRSPQFQDYCRRFPGCTGAILRAFARSQTTIIEGLAATQSKANLSSNTDHAVQTDEWSFRYHIQSELTRGAMGAVYRARHRTLDMPVAIKVLLPGGSPERFLHEARLLASINSPYVVKVHDFDILADGRPMICMEWVEGSDLRQKMVERGDAIKEVQALAWMRQVADGMRTAAELGITHRDLKPSNILIDSQNVARVADFGLARSDVELQSATQSDSLMGTPYYMAPEQAEDPRAVDTRADIYSFGATFYHALTGRAPFEGHSALSVLFKHKTEPLISPRARNNSISDSVSQIIERCLAKSPGDRFQTFDELSRHLRELSGTAALWDDADDAVLLKYLDRYNARRDDYLNYRFEEDQFDFPGRRVLRILAGDIVDQKVDAIVSSDDSDLLMRGGVSYGIATAAGSTFIRAARGYAPVRPGRVIVTQGAGLLSARFVFHAIILGMGDEKPLLPSRDVIAGVMDGCLYHADSLYVKKIAFPLLGTGQAGFPKDTCLDMMFRFLARKFLHGLTSVEEARITLLSPRDAKLQWYARIRQRRESQQQEQEPL